MHRSIIIAILCGVIFLIPGGNSANHPLDPLSPQEIAKTVQIFENYNKASYLTPNDYIYSYIALLEPPKSLLLPSFISGATIGRLPRKAFLNLVKKTTREVYEAVINLDTYSIESFILIDNVRGPLTPSDVTSEDLDHIKADGDVQKRCAEAGYPNMSLIRSAANNVPFSPNDPESEKYWAKRVVHYIMFGTNYVADNYHAHPLGFRVIYDMVDKVVLEIQELSTHSDFSTDNTGVQAPRGEGNYDYELRPGGKESLRKDDKPIFTKFPQGVSYKIEGNEIQWQKWRMRVGYNGREGLTLHTVSYNDSGQVRPILYRASLAELFVPYGDPRPPYHENAWYDIGGYGLGYYVDSLKPGEDVPAEGTSFLPAHLHTSQGIPRTVQNAISVREEDAGILWKHVDWRTKKGVVTRSHRLVITVVTTANHYDYSFSWKFYQDGSIQFKVQLLGLLFTSMVAPEASAAGYGTLVAPRISGQFHQHFFTLYLDLEVDGAGNSVSALDVVPLPRSKVSNPYGQGFTTRQTPFRTVAQGRSKIDPEKGRTWIITNPSRLNNITRKPVGWKLIPSTSTPLLMKEDSPMRKGAAWLEYDLWVSPYREGELYPGGRYVNGSGLTKWAASNPEESIENRDIVLWHSFGLCHITRPEDYPIMPVETAGFWLKPFNFFNENPGMDVPPANGH